MGRDLQRGSTMMEQLKEMLRKINEEVWKPFDSADPMEWYLLIFGYMILAIFILGVWI